MTSSPGCGDAGKGRLVTASTQAVLDRALRSRVVPVATVEDLGVARPLAAALLAGGATTIEVTFRTPAAVRVVEALAGGSLVVGAGTIRTPEQADDAVAAGAQFLVSPGLDRSVVEHGHSLGVPVVPGVATATELGTALALGVPTVKLFPAGPLGGAQAIKALSGPFPEARFVPTGGLTGENVGEYFRLPQVVAIGGSWMVAHALLSSRDWHAVEALTAQAVCLGSTAAAPVAGPG
jgi:2-dehydro-3-deoxyphosphogluconate aldolase/(4S)-4-hydroxy-2-oxoglutarate aldolase